MVEDVKKEILQTIAPATDPSPEMEAKVDPEVSDLAELRDALDLSDPEGLEISRPDPVLYFPPPPARSPAPSSTTPSRHRSLALSEVLSDPVIDMHCLTVSDQEPLYYKACEASHLVKDATSFHDVRSSRPSPVVSPEPRLDRRLSRVSQDIGTKMLARISQMSDPTETLSQDSLDLRLDHRLTFGGVSTDHASATNSTSVPMEHFTTFLEEMERTDAKCSALEDRLNATDVTVASMINRMDQLVDLLQAMSTSISGSSPELPFRASFEEIPVQDDRLHILSDQLTSMAVSINQLLANSAPDRTTSLVRQNIRTAKGPEYPLSPPQEGTFATAHDREQIRSKYQDSASSVTTYDSASVNKKRQSMLDMQKMQSARPSQMQLTVPSAASSINDLRLHPNIVKVLQLRGLDQLTSMQQRAIPFVLGGEDIIVQCPRGPLRMATHSVPIAQMIDPDRQVVQALIIAESPSTIKQIRDFLFAIFVGTKVIVMSADGKIKLTDELAQLGAKATCPHIVIATPQRSLDLIHSFHGDTPAGTKSPVSSIKVVVVDDLESILASPSLRKQVPTTLTKMLPNAMNRLTLSFASHLPEPVLTFAASLRKKTRLAHVLVKKQSTGSSASEQTSKSTKGLLKAVPQFYIYIAIEREEWKLDALIDMLEDAPKVPMAVIWCKDDDGVERIAYRCVMASWEVFSVQSQLGPSQREKVLNDFRAGRSMISSKGPALKGRLLVVADGCALKPTDLHQVPLAVGYDLPLSPEDYVKRIACVLPSTYGRSGVVVNITTSRAGDMDMLKAIQEYTRVEMKTMPSNLSDVL